MCLLRSKAPVPDAVSCPCHGIHCVLNIKSEITQKLAKCCRKHAVAISIKDENIRKTIRWEILLRLVSLVTRTPVSPPEAAIMISISRAALSSQPTAYIRPPASRCNPTLIEQRTTAAKERRSSQASQFLLRILNQFRIKDGS